MEDGAGSTGPSVRGGALGWAVFLGMSWTWCIGMFLPVLMVRELGGLGWAIFALPNVLGAAAMGWILRTREASLELVERHRPACIAFSLVTVAFHLYFAEWFLGHRLLTHPMSVAVWAAAYLFFFLGGQRGQWDRIATSVALVISLACAAIAIRSLWREPIFSYPMTQPRGPMAAAAMAPVCIFGFLLCPYLDLTFHRARQALSAREAKLAFSIGFGLFFLAMIVFTYFYVWPVARMLLPSQYPLPYAFRWGVGIHMIVQAGLTIALHLRSTPPVRRLWQWGLMLLVVAAPLLLGNWVSRLDRSLTGPGALDPGEIGYRMFMAFYGMVFPAYVWVAMIPRRRPISLAKAYVVVAAAVAVAAPFFYRGFIQTEMMWLIPGVAILLLSRLVPIARPVR